MTRLLWVRGSVASATVLAALAVASLALVLAVVVLLSARADAEVLLDRVLAVADDEVILLGEFNARYVELHTRLQQRDPERVPPASELRRQLLDQMVLERLQLQLAVRASIQISDRELNEALSRMAAEQGLEIDGMIDRLEREGGDYIALRQQLREQMIIERVQLVNVRRRLHLSAQEIEDYLASVAGAALLETRYHLFHVRLPLAADASPTREERVREQLSQLRERAAGSDLLRAAATIESQRLRSADLKWRTRSELPYLFEQVVAKMTVGEILGPLRNESGLHLIQLQGRRGKGETETELHVRHILLVPSELRDASQSRANLERLRRRLLDGASFAPLAQEYSEDNHSKLSGGDLGWVRAKQVDADFAEAMLALAVGELSRVVQSRHGFHLIEVLERRQRDVAEEEARRRVGEFLYRQRYPQELQTWLDELRDSAYVDLRW